MKCTMTVGLVTGIAFSTANLSVNDQIKSGSFFKEVPQPKAGGGH